MLGVQASGLYDISQLTGVAGYTNRSGVVKLLVMHHRNTILASGNNCDNVSRKTVVILAISLSELDEASQFIKCTAAAYRTILYVALLSHAGCNSYSPRGIPLASLPKGHLGSGQSTSSGKPAERGGLGKVVVVEEGRAMSLIDIVSLLFC